MQIQPYFPEPIVVAGNAAKEPHRVTLAFTRRVIAWHLVTAAAVLLSATLLPNSLEPGPAVAGYLSCLLALTFVRRFLDGGTPDNWLSGILLIPTAWTFGVSLAHANQAGWPVWSLGIALGMAALYGMLCGIDYSFVGQVVIASLGLVASCVALVLAGWIDPSEGTLAVGLGLLYLLFYVYDLAALLSRRRLGEEAAASADLYRDLLNFITYSVRVVLHWRRFRFI